MLSDDERKVPQEKSVSQLVSDPGQLGKEAAGQELLTDARTSSVWGIFCFEL